MLHMSLCKWKLLLVLQQLYAMVNCHCTPVPLVAIAVLFVQARPHSYGWCSATDGLLPVLPLSLQS
jgi:hypothetical protein